MVDPGNNWSRKQLQGLLMLLTALTLAAWPQALGKGKWRGKGGLAEAPYPIHGLG